MAIPVIIAGALKAALKTAVKKVAVEVAKSGATAVTKEVLKQAAKKAITDTQAILLNRLKSAPSKILYEYVSKEMGIPINEIKKIVKVFNQTPQQKKAATGKDFRDMARGNKKAAKDLGLNDKSKIKDIKRKVEEKNNQRKKDDRINDGTDENYTVLSLLTELQVEFNEKVHGISNAESSEKKEIAFNLDLMKYYKKDKKYTSANVRLLEVLIKNMSLDVERYSGGDVVLTETSGGKWERYDKAAMLEFINDIKENTKLALQ